MFGTEQLLPDSREMLFDRILSKFDIKSFSQ